MRIVPDYQNGKHEGIKLFGIRPCSLFACVGLRNGDIVHTINGLGLTAPGRALEASEKLRSASRFVLDLTRRGQPLSLRITLR
jgi:general secretion pathway protein C